MGFNSAFKGLSYIAYSQPHFGGTELHKNV